MTKEDAKELLKAIKKGNYLGGIIDIPSDESAAFDMAIKALDQGPCEDAVSRYDAVRIVQHNNPPKSIEKLRNLPPVTPTRKKGKWTFDDGYPDSLICNKCRAKFDVWHWEQKQMHYCPNCGAEMESEE